MPEQYDLEALNDALDAKFREITSFLGKELFGEDHLTDDQREHAADAAQDAIDEWDMTETINPVDPSKHTPFQVLLEEYLDLSSTMMRAQDLKHRRQTGSA